MENLFGPMTAGPEGISVVVCCYNSQERLVPTLNHLFAQRTNGIDWEIIVVDNNSTDSTQAVAQQLHASSGSTVPFTTVSEPRPGLTYARACGFSASTYNTILLVDDDNWLMPTYVQTVFNILAQRTEIGIMGGRAEAVYDGPAPDWFAGLAHIHAIGDPWGVNSQELTMVDAVYGAGMAIRKTVLAQLAAAHFNSQLSDRKGSSLSSGGDTELCLAAGLAGWKVAYNPELNFKHVIPAGRLDWNYLCRLYKGFGRAKPYIDLYHHYLAARPMPTDSAKLPYWADRLYHLTIELIKSDRLSAFSLMFGTGSRLIRLSSMAHVDHMREVFGNRNRYMNAVREVDDLQQRLQQKKTA